MLFKKKKILAAPISPSPAEGSGENAQEPPLSDDDHWAAFKVTI